MSLRVNDFLKTFSVPYEGMDFGANIDLLPASLARVMENWLVNWDPRRLRRTVLSVPEPTVNMSTLVYFEGVRYYEDLREKAHFAALKALGLWSLLPYRFSIDWYK